MSTILEDIVGYVHRPVQNHVLENSRNDAIWPRKFLRRLSQQRFWSSTVHYLYIVNRVFERRGVSCCLVALSNGLCAYLGYYDTEAVFDPAFFKALAMLIGFMLSFRATRANQRRTEAYILAETLCRCGRDIVYLLPPDQASAERQELKQILRYVFWHITYYLTERSGRLVHFDLSKIAVERRKKLLPCGSGPELHISPRKLVASLTYVVMEIYLPVRERMKRDRVAKIGGGDPTLSGAELVMVENHVREKVGHLSMINDQLTVLSNSRTTSMYTCILELPLFLFVAGFPWVMKVTSANSMLLASFFVALVYYGVDVVAEEADDPLGTDITDIPVDSMAQELFELLDFEDEVFLATESQGLLDSVEVAARGPRPKGESHEAWRRGMEKLMLSQDKEPSELFTAPSTMDAWAGSSGGNWRCGAEQVNACRENLHNADFDGRGREYQPLRYDDRTPLVWTKDTL